MATSKTRSWDDGSELAADYEREPLSEKSTSIVAHVVRSISVTMSAAEMDVLVGTFGRARSEFTQVELDVVDEFTREVGNVRFR